jgi:hypothetical protein
MLISSPKISIVLKSKTGSLRRKLNSKKLITNKEKKYSAEHLKTKGEKLKSEIW